ncbi:hypothetical protein AUP68_02179 [Ilyonectria robusta]
MPGLLLRALLLKPRSRLDQGGCRTRKKRCYHDNNPPSFLPPTKDQDCDSGVGIVQDGEASPFDSHQESTIAPTSSTSPVPVHEYDPESVLEDLSPLAQPLTGDQLEPCPAPLRASLSRTQTTACQSARRKVIWYRRYKRRTAVPKLSEHHRKYLEDVGALLELPRTTSEGLLPIYISLLDDLIPVMDAVSVFRDLSNGRSSIYLVRAICLVICKAQQAAPFLRLRDGGPLLNHMNFASKLLAGLDAAIKANLEPDRVTKIQVLALMHLHNDGQGGVDRSSSYLSQAISEAWSVSLHFTIAGNSEQEQCDYLWWSLRNFDRLNKPIMGAAPFIIDDTDISIKRISPTAGTYRSRLMAVSLILGDLMATATKVYKASSTATVDDCQYFPSFAELTSGVDLNSCHRAHRGYLEIWYHVAAMLSCRHSGPGTIHYTRRLASADSVLGIIAQGQHKTLPPLPLVPYAISMATTVIYRALRDGRRDTDTAFHDLGLCCNALDSLGQRWTSAQGVARLAKRLWRSCMSVTVDQQPSDANQPAQSSDGADSRTTGTAEETSRHENDAAATLDESLLSTAVSLQPNHPCMAGQASDSHQSYQDQFAQPLLNLDGPCSQFNEFCDDLFDYGMSEVFRYPASWEFLHITGGQPSFEEQYGGA